MKQASKRYKFREKQEEKSYKNIKLKEHENLLDMSCRVIFWRTGWKHNCLRERATDKPVQWPLQHLRMGFSAVNQVTRSPH